MGVAKVFGYFFYEKKGLGSNPSTQPFGSVWCNGSIKLPEADCSRPKYAIEAQTNIWAFSILGGSMASINRSSTRGQNSPLTHEGAKASIITPEQQLRRSVMSCLLWESTFYEDGVAIADRIQSEVATVLKQKNGADIVGNIAFEARTKFKLRHVPLLLALALVRDGSPEARSVVAGLLSSIIQRPDELSEFVALYWKDGKCSLSAQVKKGLATAFQKFDRYSLSKYATREGNVRLRDVLFLTHPSPLNDEQATLWKELADDTIKAPDTWEAALSSGADKKETFTRLLNENALGPLALLRNLRGMREAGVDEQLIRSSIGTMKTERVLPFRFITAAKYAPNLEDVLETAMFKCLDGSERLPGRTLLLVDGSGSMKEKLSAKSEMTRWEAACALAMLVRETVEQGVIAVFSNHQFQVAPRRGFALRDALWEKAEFGGTDTGDAVNWANQTGYDRIIVFTDEQSRTSVPNPLPESKAYMVNVANYQNGIGYGNGWAHIDGFSEAVIDYIQMYEKSFDCQAEESVA